MASTPNTVCKTVQLAGGNLFSLAALEYGDATQWNRIAQANNLFDPMINGIVTLVIPPANPNSANGGILEVVSGA